MKTSDLLQSKREARIQVSCKVNEKPFGLHLLCKRPEVYMIRASLTLQETGSIHDSMNIPKMNSFLKWTYGQIYHSIPDAFLKKLEDNDTIFHQNGEEGHFK